MKQKLRLILSGIVQREKVDYEDRMTLLDMGDVLKP